MQMLQPLLSLQTLWLPAGKFSGQLQAKGLRKKIKVTLDFSCTQ